MGRRRPTAPLYLMLLGALCYTIFTPPGDPAGGPRVHSYGSAHHPPRPMTGVPRRAAVLAAAVFNVGMNALAGAGILFGATTGSVSDAVPTGITPASWAFSIWSVIFLGVLVFAGWQLRPSARYDGLAAPFVAANVFNGLWQIPWLTGRFFLAAGVILVILASLILLYIRLGRLRLSTPERWALGLPISLFLAWITVATVLNITVALASAGWTQPGFWPPLVALVVAGIGAAVLLGAADIAFAAVLLWAFAAIYAGNRPAPALTAALALGALLVAASLVVGLRRSAAR